MNWALAILLLVFLGAGVPIFLGALVSAFRTLRIRSRASHVEGVIVEAKQGEWKRAALERRRAEGRTVLEVKRPHDVHQTTTLIWTLTIEFEDTTGAKQQGTMQAGTRKKPYEVGERVPIWYDPEQPSAIRIDSFAELWGGPLLMGAFGATFLVVGLLLWSGVISLK